MTKFKPSLKLDLDGDTYTLSIINEESGQSVKEMKFQSGVEFEDEISDSLTVRFSLCNEKFIFFFMINITFVFHGHHDYNQQLCGWLY